MVGIDREARLRAARLSLRGLALGDSFGERFFGAGAGLIEGRRLPPAPWGWTDDSAMAISIVETLGDKGSIDQDGLVRRFAARHAAEPWRGYGGGAARLLSAVSAGADWRVAARSLFRGSGSWGNGAAMRAAPVGAWFSDDAERAAREAAASAEVTHAHPEGIAGGVAVAVAAALMASSARGGQAFGREAFFAGILDLVAAGRTREGIESARGMADASPDRAAAALGTGREVSAMDTVPFCLWAAARWHSDYREALWGTVAGGGDRDTTCAIVGGIVALAAPAGLPAEWEERRERLPGEAG